MMTLEPEQTAERIQEPPRFALNYDVTREDYAAMLHAQIGATRRTRKSANLWNIVLYLVVGLPLGIGVGWLDDHNIIRFEITAAFFGGIVVSMMGFYAYWLFFYVRHYASKAFELNRLAGKRIAVEADATGLRTAIDSSSAAYAWHAVERVDEDAERFLIWVSGMAAVIVPKRAFDSEGESVTFGAALKEWTGGQNK